MCTTDDHEHYFVGCPSRLSQKLQREILRPKRRMIISGLSYRDYNDKTSNANTMKSDVYGLYFLSNPPFFDVALERETEGVSHRLVGNKPHRLARDRGLETEREIEERTAACSSMQTSKTD